MHYDINVPTAPMDYIAINGQDLTFPADSMNGDTVTVDVVINNDNVLESTGEMFFADITSGNADIEMGRGRASIQLNETNDDGERVCTKNSLCNITCNY